ncbi:MAG: hypothetical protein ACI9BD_001176, partial [Candidatus Marinamargulisbacteria bacterium]
MKKQFLVILCLCLTMTALYAGDVPYSSFQFKNNDTDIQAALEWAEGMTAIQDGIADGLYDLLSVTSQPNRYLRTVLELPVLFLEWRFSWAVATSVHEVGHAAVMRHDGRFPSFGQGDRQNLSIWELYLGNIVSSERSYTHLTEASPVSVTNRQRALEIGAGINANTQFAERLNRRSLRRHKYRYREAITMLTNKSYGAGYFATGRGGADPFGDPSQYLLAIENQGHSVNYENVFLIKSLASLISGSTLNAIRTREQFVLYNASGGSPLAWQIGEWDLFIPEWMVYLNEDSVSILGEFFFRHVGMPLLSVGFEQSFMGNSFSKEGSFSISDDLREFAYDLRFTMNARMDYFYQLYGHQELLKQF